MRALIVVLLIQSACCAGPKQPEATRSVYEYRVSRMIRMAVHLQSLDIPARKTRLRELAGDPRVADDFFPLCRMLFEPRPKREFRPPMLGMPSFAGSKEFKDWPLEPITIYRGIPISIVRGYTLFGVPEPPQKYLEYCLAECAWGREKFAYIDRQTQRVLIGDFIQSRPDLAADSDWLLAQAK